MTLYLSDVTKEILQSGLSAASEPCVIVGALPASYISEMPYTVTARYLGDFAEETTQKEFVIPKGKTLKDVDLVIEQVIGQYGAVANKAFGFDIVLIVAAYGRGLPCRHIAFGVFLDCGAIHQYPIYRERR